MKHSLKSILPIVVVFFLAFIGSLTMAFSQSQDTLLAQYSVYQSDSLIQANTANPDFVIMDVRTSGPYYAAHLLGAINRNYYASNFDDLIDALPRHKLYLVHCQSGGRSFNTYNLMVGMNFTKVVNMLGGMNAWNAASLPTTTVFGPLLMAVSDTIVAMETIAIGIVDTISLKITNRANLNLTFSSITSLTGTEFTTDFDLSTALQGAEDYTFLIFYEPQDEISDTLDFLIESNGGNTSFQIYRTGITPMEFTVNIPAGWSGISSCVVPNDPAVKNVFELIVDELVILQNYNGIYWPAAGVNSIGNWDEHSGYMVKMETAQQLTFTGEMQTNLTVDLIAGWNYLPVLNDCENNVVELFSQIGDHLQIAMEIAGSKVYWPEFGIVTLDKVIPGKAYFVKVDKDVVIEFPVCP